MARVHPLTGQPKKTNWHPRPELLTALVAMEKQRRLRAGYDAAGSSAAYANYWAGATNGDADAANSKAVRSQLVPRARYEVESNPYSDGIHATWATDVIGTGPKLRMQTRIPAFNQIVEFLWGEWCKAIQFRRKLWCCAHARLQDGEGLGIGVNNPAADRTIKLDWKLIETEQMQTPFLPYDQLGYCDGVRFDEFGNVLWYDILPHHPHSQYGVLVQQPERVAPRFVQHWYKLRRPGQHRGIPGCTSSLPIGADGRRFRLATVGAAEVAADLAVLLKTGFQPNEVDEVQALSTTELQRRMAMALPMGWDALQLKAEHPNTLYPEFLKSLIAEQGRPLGMPYLKSAGDASGHNFSSAKLDSLGYYAVVDSEREDCTDLVLDPLFELWWTEAVRAYGWNPGNGKAGPHAWDFPEHPIADVETHAKANDTKLRSGQTSLPRIYTEMGLDFEDELPAMAESFGITPEEMRLILLHEIFPTGAAAVLTPPPPPPTSPVTTAPAEGAPTNAA